MSATDPDWVELAEHVPAWANSGIDGVGLQLLYIEQALIDDRIDSVFQPVRPSEGGSAWASDFRRPVRLIVQARDLV